ncbi:MAG: hypothetical protein IRZ28_18070 [Steroidobacteraceae bacterium]|nr:hypothetical protein [Steroidobacteraceae bacterium]
MNSSEIAAELGRVKTSADARRLYRECEGRIAELNARAAEITPASIPSLPHPPERQRALLTSPEAIKQLDDELTSISLEVDHLLQLKTLAFEAAERVELDEIRRGIPEARKRLPKLMREVREAMSRYDSALATLDDALNLLCAYDRAGLEFPLSDEELAEVLRLRDEVWRIRTLNPPGLDDRERFPLSWPLMFEWHSQFAYHTRCPPVPHSFPGAMPVER